MVFRIGAGGRRGCACSVSGRAVSLTSVDAAVRSGKAGFLGASQKLYDAPITESCVLTAGFSEYLARVHDRALAISVPRYTAAVHSNRHTQVQNNPIVHTHTLYDRSELCQELVLQLHPTRDTQWMHSSHEFDTVYVLAQLH